MKPVKFILTPVTNVDYERKAVINEDNEHIFTFECDGSDALPIEINGTALVYRAKDIDIKISKLIHNGVRCEILHRYLKYEKD